MKKQAVTLYGNALMDYFQGDRSAQITIRQGNGQVSTNPIARLFSKPLASDEFERAAIACCFGAVLDVAAGCGQRSLLSSSASPRSLPSNPAARRFE